MFVSEDGTVTGSIDVSKLDEIKAKTDEAKAQIKALKAERDAGQAQADADADRVAAVHEAQNAPLLDATVGSDRRQGSEAKGADDQSAERSSTRRSTSTSDKG